MSNQYGSAQIVNDGLVLCLDAADSNSYPGSGNTWTDLTGNDNFAITAGSTYSANPAKLNLANINALNNLGASVPAAWQNTDECTIDLWYRMQSMYGACCDTIFGRYDFRFFQIGNSVYTMISFANPGRYYQHPAYSIASEPGGTAAWHHLVGMRRGNDFIIWIDGAEKHNSTFGTGLPLYDVTEPWYINTNRHDADYAVARIWNRGLSDAEILHNFNAQRGRFGK
jgi:hypothetical protein